MWYLFVILIFKERIKYPLKRFRGIQRKDLGCLDVIINDTITDYNGSDKKNEWGYGNLDNQASKLRSEGFYKAKSKNWI